MNSTSSAGLYKVGIKFIFHWKGQLLIEVEPLRRVLAHVSIWFTTEKREVSSAKRLQFEGSPLDKSFI